MGFGCCGLRSSPKRTEGCTFWVVWGGDWRPWVVGQRMVYPTSSSLFRWSALFLDWSRLLSMVLSNVHFCAKCGAFGLCSRRLTKASPKQVSWARYCFFSMRMKALVIFLRSIGRPTRGRLRVETSYRAPSCVVAPCRDPSLRDCGRQGCPCIVSHAGWGLECLWLKRGVFFAGVS